MFDNISKFLIEQYSPDFASWLIGEPIDLTELSPVLSQVSVGEASRNENRVAVLRAVVEAIDALPDRQQQRNLTAATGILAGLVLDKQLIRHVLRKELMEESVIYQELRADARAEARQEVFQEVRQAVLQAVRQEVLQEGRLEGERSLILRLLALKVGDVPDVTKTQIEALSLTQLEALGEALLNFATVPDLSEWLERLPQ